MQKLAPRHDDCNIRPIRCANRAELDAVCEWFRDRGIRALSLLIEHDAHCAPGAGRCFPTYLVQPLSVETLQAGATLDREWREQARA